MSNFPCPVCHVDNGFHDNEPHASLVIPRDKLILTARQRRALQRWKETGALRDDRI